MVPSTDSAGAAPAQVAQAAAKHSAPKILQETTVGNVPSNGATIPPSRAVISPQGAYGVTE